MSLSLRHIVDQLFSEVRHVKEQQVCLTDEILSALHFVFHQTLVHALDLVDQRNVTRLATPSGRVVYQVLGSSNQTYNCLTTGDFCTCPSYTFTVLIKMESLMCKHLLAVYLAEALDACKKRVISDEEFVAYMCYDSTAEDNRNKKETFNHRTNPTVSNT